MKIIITSTHIIEGPEETVSPGKLSCDSSGELPDTVTDLIHSQTGKWGRENEQLTDSVWVDSKKQDYCIPGIWQ